MKKLLTIALSLVMVFSMTAVSFADETTYDDQRTVTITKTYDATNPGTTSPAETFSFSALTCTNVTDAGVGVTAENAPVPTIDSVSYNAGEAGSNTKTKNITITLPEYTAVGVYTYTFTENDNKTAGVTYREGAITLKVTVVEQNGKKRVAAVHTEGADATKSDKFTNTYSAGSLTVKKAVTGLLGDKAKDFTVNVTFKAPEGKTVKEAITYVDSGETKTISVDKMADGTETVAITLKDKESVTFTNIPYDVTYEVSEASYTSEGYNATYDNNKTGAISTASVETIITNDKGGTIDTGIFFDNGIYIAILAIVLIAAAAFIIRRRQHRYDA